MNQDELIEKCRLTDEELYNVCCDDLYKDGWQAIADAQLRKAIPIIQKAERERLLLALERMSLIKNHYGHKKWEVKIISCPRCTYDEYKEQALKGESDGIELR